MVLTQRLARPFQSARIWIGLGVLAPIGMLVVSGLMLLDLRRDAWDKAEQTSRNLLQVIERDIARNIEVFDLSLRAAVENLLAPGIDRLDPAMRHLVLFDRAATARDMGVMLVLDEHGDIADDIGAIPPRKGNYADREYFRIHRERPDLGLFVGKPIVSRLTGEPMLPFSRRIAKPDGSFGGVVLSSLKLTYFSRLFDQIALGQEGAINLYLHDGTRIIRYPYDATDVGVSIAGSSTFDQFLAAPSGAFIGTSVRDGVERHYSFMRVGDLPLVLNVALSTRDVEAEWRAKALGLGATVLILCGLTVSLSLLFGRELNRRAAAEAELAHQSRTDALTGLPNRRRFDEVFERAWKSARRTGKPLSLLIVDADHFKRYNDRYGHAIGDAVLKGLARGLAGSVHRPNDLVSRIGGEEFALLLPDADAAGALRVAEAVHARIADLVIGSADINADAVTVSIGLAGANDRDAEPADLFRRADDALYAAKAHGRNRTMQAPDTGNEGLPMPRIGPGHGAASVEKVVGAVV